MSCKPKTKVGLEIVVALMLVFWMVSTAAAGTLQAELADGVVIRVHLESGLGVAGTRYAQTVLEAAREAYQEVAFRQGFNRPGFTFADADRGFAYDADRAIDIYLQEQTSPRAVMTPQGGWEYKAEIYLPADYQEYQQRFQIEQPRLELKAALVHEILHIITYSYNRNMRNSAQGKVSLTPQRWDWYTEGLARYFETLVGYRQEFLSSGFMKTSGNKVKVYKGGVNYFLKHPDKPLSARRYDFALFWQYLHQDYGMEAIEEISCRFREVNPNNCTNQQAMQIIGEVLGVPARTLLEEFSIYLYEASSLTGKRQAGLKNVYLRHLISCRNKKMSFRVSSLGFDFYEIDLHQGLKSIRVESVAQGQKINCILGLTDSFSLRRLPVEQTQSGITAELGALPRKQSLVIMVSNPGESSIPYSIFVK